jgi:hypothetical protein
MTKSKQRINQDSPQCPSVPELETICKFIEYTDNYLKEITALIGKHELAKFLSSEKEKNNLLNEITANYLIMEKYYSKDKYLTGEINYATYIGYLYKSIIELKTKKRNLYKEIEEIISFCSNYLEISIELKYNLDKNSNFLVNEAGLSQLIYLICFLAINLDQVNQDKGITILCDPSSKGNNFIISIIANTEEKVADHQHYQLFSAGWYKQEIYFLYSIYHLAKINEFSFIIGQNDNNSIAFRLFPYSSVIDAITSKK